MKRWWRRSVLSGASVFLTISCGRLHKEPFEKAPLSPGQIQVAQIGEESNLVIERVRFWSDEMKEPRFFLALIPKGPGPSVGAADQKTPAKTKPEPASPTRSTEPFHPSEIFILNHGWTDRPEYLLDDLHVDRVYNEMLGQGKLRPAIIVIPDVRFPYFNMERTDRYPFPNYLTLVGEEVASTASKRYGVPFERQHWSIGGFSFGGYLSLDVGRRFGGRFSTVSVVSGFSDEDWTYWPTEPPPPGRLDSRGRGRNSIVVPGPAPRLFLACGTNDRLYPSMLALHEKLTALQIPHQWWTGPGGHTWKLWSAVLPIMLEFTLGKNPPRSDSFPTH